MVPFHDQFRTIQHFWVDPDWLGQRMLFLSGPRQIGKTTLVTHTLCSHPKAYFNWDHRTIRQAFQKDPDFFVGVEAPWICFDEIHKRPKWKDILKGIYDVYKHRYRFVITGSARLETFKKSGDSLVGRYFQTSLFPLNLSDFQKTNFTLPQQPKELLLSAADLTDATQLEALLELGGFPEPFFSGSKSFWKRWSSAHLELVLTEDLRDLSKVMEVDKVEALMSILKPSIGRTISYRNLAQDLETTHASVKRWLSILSKLHVIFPISPYSKTLRRVITQEKKWYFVDWKVAEGNVFENYIASSLLRTTELYTHRYGEKMSLHFIRTHDGAEVDFLICKNQQPWLLVEAKEGEPIPSSAVHRFAQVLKIPAIVATRKKNFFKKITTDHAPDIYCISWAKLGQLLP